MISIAHLTNGAAIMGVAAVILIGGRPEPAPAIDGLTVASIVAASNANRFQVFDHAGGGSCAVSVHRAQNDDIHRVEPLACDAMPAGLSDARTWQDSTDGHVRITDRHGRTILRLGPSDGFAWEVIEPAGLAISFEAG